mgnify:CR=1 FL=1
MLDKKDKQYIEEIFGRYTQVMKEEFISQIKPIAEMLLTDTSAFRHVVGANWSNLK